MHSLERHPAARPRPRFGRRPRKNKGMSGTPAVSRVCRRDQARPLLCPQGTYRRCRGIGPRGQGGHRPHHDSLRGFRPLNHAGEFAGVWSRFYMIH
jgi:hypothetical protein